jgi:thioredoxin-like negative regulator of GroEL
MHKKPKVTTFDQSNTKQFDEKIKHINGIILFHHPECIHCVMLRPKWEMMKRKLNNDCEIMEVNVSALEQSNSPIRKQVQGYPMIVHVQNGIIKHRFEQERNIENLIKFINHHINNKANKLEFNYKVIKNNSGKNKLKKITKRKKNNKTKKQK